MATDIPFWIDSRYVKSILKKSKYDESVEIIDISVNPATEKGDNYLSDMYRVGIEFTWVKNGNKIRENKSVIVKVEPTDNRSDEEMPLAYVFETEMKMMLNTLPRMNEMLNELGMNALSADCLLVQREDPVHLVFEDLAARGFRMGSRQTGLDLDHCSLLFHNLARFHACSVALREKDPQALVNYTKGIFHMDHPPLFHHLVTRGLKDLSRFTREWDEISPLISEKLLKLSEVGYEKACEAISYREGEFNVLNHGDCWVNNMMFSYDEFAKPIDLIFVDFQVCHYGSPADDILRFFATSPTDDVRINHREFLLHKYHKSLTNTMNKLKCATKTPSFDELQEILRKRAFLEAIMSFVALPFILLDKSEAKSFKEMNASIVTEDYDNPAYCNNDYKKIMIRLLPMYDNMGLLDS